MRRFLAASAAVLAALASSMALASEADVDPALRTRAEAVCRDDAVRLCANAIPDETAILACMRPKRTLLSAPCRRVFDEVVLDLRR